MEQSDLFKNLITEKLNQIQQLPLDTNLANNEKTWYQSYSKSSLSLPL